MKPTVPLPETRKERTLERVVIGVMSTASLILLVWIVNTVQTLQVQQSNMSGYFTAKIEELQKDIGEIKTKISPDILPKASVEVKEMKRRINRLEDFIFGGRTEEERK